MHPGAHMRGICSLLSRFALPLAENVHRIGRVHPHVQRFRGIG
jgi:hypothetical protein